MDSPNETVTGIRRKNVFVRVPIILDFLDPSSVNGVIPTTRVNQKVVRMIPALDGGVDEQNVTLPHHRKLLIDSVVAKQLGIRYGRFVRHSVTVEIMEDRKQAFHGGVGNKDRSDPVVNEAVWHILRATVATGRYHNLAPTNAGCSLGGLVNPQKGLIRVEMLLHSNVTCAEIFLPRIDRRPLQLN
jgi:hypothetical protein